MLTAISSGNLSLFKNNASLESDTESHSCGCSSGNSCHGCSEIEWNIETPHHICTSNCKKERRTLAEWMGPIIIPCPELSGEFNEDQRNKSITPHLPVKVWKKQLYNLNMTYQLIDDGQIPGEGVLHPEGSGDIGTEGKGSQTLCNESGIGGKEVKFPIIQIEGSNQAGSYKMKVEGRLIFARFPFYYHLFFEVSTKPYKNMFFIYLHMIPKYYHVRCGVTVGPEYITWGGWAPDTQKQYNSYQGPKNLNKVYFRGFYQVDYEFLPGQWSTWYVGSTATHFFPKKNWKEIRQNY